MWNLCFATCVNLRADLRIRLAALRKSVRKFWFANLHRLASPFGQDFTVSERCLVSELKLFWFMCLGKRVWAAHTLMVWGIFFIVSKFTTPEFPLWLFFSLFFLSDNRSGVCYRSVTASRCGEPFKRVSKKDVCCCSVGAAWGKPCEECPLLNTGAPVVLWLQESALC